MQALSNELLIQSYFQAKNLRLNEQFIQLLLEEIKRRELHLSEIKKDE
ncbi:sporulation protein [Alkalihalobacillus alcalophilus ATCC 27647 = CGMCC 1.3604]|uniref:Sporulation protein n=1 Tax=Alkalihalobacillus alcalophilus ATCC 27647 = CGMCC 1.3604 TaxID=1218173 RepID=A0A4S4K107_ALKAL|nr:sporulation histidine kinase inhibitor Sda [Alkalihalobacillus alcalophilus]MED1562555.1 sporulation histidine kinase inhibitor Sda [Alkalihalobacillus alcalophilus]THG91288.1 sporulation protein [Alkalihalobacillus alcalophilus ATCC 27647 = CGMCC 1.3604]